MLTEEKLTSYADGVALAVQDDHLEADRVLMAIVNANRKPSYSELLFFQSRLGWDERSVNKQLGRMRHVVRLRAIAGTAADREAARQEAETAAAVLATEGPKIAEQIEKLQAKLRGLESDAALSAKRSEEQGQAVVQLRDHVPVTINEQVNARRQALNKTLGDEIRSAEIRQNELECCLDRERFGPGDKGEIGYFEGVRHSFPDAVVLVTMGTRQRYQFTAAWQNEIKPAVEAELAKLKSDLAEMRAQWGAEITSIEADLNYYTNEGQQNV